MWFLKRKNKKSSKTNILSNGRKETTCNLKSKELKYTEKMLELAYALYR